METAQPFIEDAASLTDEDLSAPVKRIGRVFEDRNQFEEAVQELLEAYGEGEPHGVFY